MPMKKNNQNKKNTEAPTMNGNGMSGTSGTGQNATTAQNVVATTTAATLSHANQANNNGTNATSSSSTLPTPTTTTSTTTTSATSSTSQPSQNHHHQHQQPHQRLSSSSSSQGNSNSSGPRPGQIPLKKSQQQQQQHSEVDKISNSGSQASQNSFRGGTKDHRARDKEKEKSFRSGGGGGAHHHQNGQAGGGQNLQNGQRKKEKNRDHSSTSHQSGYSGYNTSQNVSHNNSSSSHHHQHANQSNQFSLTESIRVVGFPPLHKTVQTDPLEPEIVVKTEPRLRRTRPKILPEQAEMVKKIDALQDTVMAFKEHDDWNKVELMCELLSFLSPVDLRLVGNCIEGSVRCYTNQMRPVEKTSNCSDPTASLPPYVCASFQPPPAPYQPILEAQKFGVLRINPPMPQGTAGPPGLPPLVATKTTQYNPETHQLLGFGPIPPSSAPTTATSTIGKEGKDVNLTNGTAPAKNQGSEFDLLEAQDPPATPSHSTLLTTTPISISTPNGPSSQPSPRNIQQEAPPVPEPPVPQDPARFLPAVKDLTSYLYVLISVCASTNRKSAAKLTDYVSKVLLPEKTQILKKIPNTLDKIEVLQDIGKIVAAIIHHPAVTVDNKIKYNELRGSLRAEIESLYLQHYEDLREMDTKKRQKPTEGVGREEESGEETYDEETDEEEVGVREQLMRTTQGQRLAAYLAGGLSASKPSRPTPSNFFITRFIGANTDRDSVYGLEIHWSDGDRTFTQRTRDQLKALQHRLLDEFGQQRSEKTSMSSFDEENKKLSASTSTMETSFAVSGDRILPRLPRDATPAQMVQYINELSDLPARMMMSAVICEEFNGTRAKTEDEFQEPADGLIFSRWKNPRATSPIRYYSNRANNGNIEPIQLPQHLTPFLYSNMPHNHLHTLFPSCSNCGGQHDFKNCDKMTLLDKKVEHKLHLEPDPSQLPTSSSAVGPLIHHGYPHPAPAGGIPPVYMDGHVMVPITHQQHYQYHQHHGHGPPQQQQMQLMNTAVAFRPSHFETPPMLVYPTGPPPLPQAPPTSQNGVNPTNF